MGCGGSTEDGSINGEIKITLVQGRGLTDKDIGAMDPYCKILWADDDGRETKAHSGGGSNPKWLETIPFKINGEPDDEIVIEIWDDDIGCDDFVGQVEMELGALLACKKNTWVTVYDKENKNACGELELSCSFSGRGAELAYGAEGQDEESDGEDVDYYENEDGTFMDEDGNTVDEEGNIIKEYDENDYDEEYNQPQPGFVIIKVRGRNRRVRRRRGAFRVAKGGRGGKGGARKILKQIKRRMAPANKGRNPARKGPARKPAHRGKKGGGGGGKRGGGKHGGGKHGGGGGKHGGGGGKRGGGGGGGGKRGGGKKGRK